MKDDIDIEEVLKRFRSDPGSRVKRAVLSRFTRRYAQADSPFSAVPFWRRPIPVYFTVALIVLAVGVSFFAGQRSSRPQRRHTAVQALPEETETPISRELEWEIAHSDII